MSSHEHGYLKPHRSIFDEALVRAGAEAASSMMVGDSLKADVQGALAAGMRAVLLRRSGDVPADVPPERARDSRADGAGGAPLTDGFRKSGRT